MNKQACRWISLGVVLLAGCVAQATDRIKANNTTSLNVSSSWTASNVPGIYDVAKWDSTVTGPNAVLLGGNMSIQGIVIASPGGDVAIGGNSTLTNGFIGFNLGAATVNLTVTNQTVSFLDYAGQYWTVAAGRTLTFGPSQAVRGAGSSVVVLGSGVVASPVLSNGATGIIAPWMWYGAGTAARYATMAAAL